VVVEDYVLCLTWYILLTIIIVEDVQNRRFLMGRMKELICNKADEVALFKYGKDFYELTKEQQDGV